MYMFVYHWHPETNEYMGLSVADESPLEPGVILVPAFATLVTPPASITDKHFLVWNGAVWIETPLHEPPIEPLAKPADPMTLLRIERNNRLLALDWIVIRAYSMGVSVSSEWATYMQALRDLPSVSTPTIDVNGNLDIASVIWPVPPS